VYKAKSAPPIRATDIISIVLIVLVIIIAWTTPERMWPTIAQALARVGTRLMARRRRTQRQRRRLVFDGRFDSSALDRIGTRFLAHRVVARLQGYREYRPGGWRPEIQVLGAENIEAALERAHGVLLWVARSAYSDLVTKKGLWEAGYWVSHLSRPSHNISSTRFGIRFLNPTWTRVEDRFLGERVRIRDDDSGSALAILRQRLKENQIVSITVLDRAKRTVQVDFLSTKLRLATAPLHLARTTKAILLPVFTFKRETGVFIVDVQSPLIGEGDNQEEPYKSVCQRYARRCERFVLHYPDQWSQTWGLD